MVCCSLVRIIYISWTGAKPTHVTSWHGLCVPSPCRPYLTALQGWCPRCMQHLSHLLSDCMLPPGHMVQGEGQIRQQWSRKLKDTHRSLSHCATVSNNLHNSAYIHKLYTLPSVWPNFAQTTGLAAWVWMATGLHCVTGCSVVCVCVCTWSTFQG